MNEELKAEVEKVVASLLETPQNGVELDMKISDLSSRLDSTLPNMKLRLTNLETGLTRWRDQMADGFLALSDDFKTKKLHVTERLTVDTTEEENISIASIVKRLTELEKTIEVQRNEIEALKAANEEKDGQIEGLKTDIANKVTSAKTELEGTINTAKADLQRNISSIDTALQKHDSWNKGKHKDEKLWIDALKAKTKFISVNGPTTEIVLGSGQHISFQGDGNVVIYRDGAGPIWKTDTKKPKTGTVHF